MLFSSAKASDLLISVGLALVSSRPKLKDRSLQPMRTPPMTMTKRPFFSFIHLGKKENKKGHQHICIRIPRLAR
jgi:hypothetical protein